MITNRARIHTSLPIAQIKAVLSIVETLEEVESLVSSVVQVLPQSAFFATVLNTVKWFCISVVHFCLCSCCVVVKWSGGTGDNPDSKSHVAFIRWLNLTLGFVRLCCSLSQLHKGVVESVTGWIYSAAHRECMERALASSGEVRFVVNHQQLLPSPFYCSHLWSDILGFDSYMAP